MEQYRANHSDRKYVLKLSIVRCNMAINNHPITIDNQDINQMRYLIEQRAEWMYELCAEMESQGMEYEPMARAAISRFG